MAFFDFILRGGFENLKKKTLAQTNCLARALRFLEPHLLNLIF